MIARSELEVGRFRNVPGNLPVANRGHTSHTFEEVTEVQWLAEAGTEIFWIGCGERSRFCGASCATLSWTSSIGDRDSMRVQTTGRDLELCRIVSNCPVAAEIELHRLAKALKQAPASG